MLEQEILGADRAITEYYARMSKHRCWEIAQRRQGTERLEECWDGCRRCDSRWQYEVRYCYSSDEDEDSGRRSGRRGLYNESHCVEMGWEDDGPKRPSDAEHGVKSINDESSTVMITNMTLLN